MRVPLEPAPGNLIPDHSPILGCFVTLVAATGSSTGSARASDAYEAELVSDTSQ